jgi:hypothetical protein
MASRTLFAFIDLKDPFMAAEIAGEERPGPIISLLAARRFDKLNLFYTPALKALAKDTRTELPQAAAHCPWVKSAKPELHSRADRDWKSSRILSKYSGGAW